MAKDTNSSAGDKTASPAIGHMEQQVNDALLLLDYAVGSGTKTADGLPIPQDSVRHIETMAAKLGLLEDGAAAGGRHDVASDDWVAFELGYYDLATALTPVTAETLRNTQSKPYAERDWYERIFGDSTAIRFTRVLWGWTFFFIFFVIVDSWYLKVNSGDGHANFTAFFKLATPWVYGGLGACVYLLRQAHIFIYERSFDVRRKPEYLNRILLGAVAGGAILLFVDKLAGSQGAIIRLSSAALGFLTGYNTDFLFSTIDRLAPALLPRKPEDLAAGQKARGTTTQPANINDLAERMEKAKGADKEFYRSLIAKLTGTLAPP